MIESQTALKVTSSKFTANDAAPGVGCAIFLRNKVNVSGFAMFYNNLFIKNTGCNGGIIVDFMAGEFVMMDYNLGNSD